MLNFPYSVHQIAAGTYWALQMLESISNKRIVVFNAHNVIHLWTLNQQKRAACGFDLLSEFVVSGKRATETAAQKTSKTSEARAEKSIF